MIKTRDELYMGPVEVITSVARRRRWNPKEKRSMVQGDFSIRDPHNPEWVHDQGL